MERKEAIEIVRKLYNESLFLKKDKEAMVTLIPELKESEDEKIRKELITHCRNTRCVTEEGAKEIVRWIAWLEKQGKQNPTDNVKPKFHEGDWIVNNDSGYAYKVIEISDDEYCLWPLDGEIMGYVRIIDVDNEYHLWTIEDAKDGDVLQLGAVTAIFKELIGDGNCRCYCSVCNGEFEIPSQDGEDNSYGCANTKPAIKEQRDTLMKAMTDNGYAFDFDKKEVKKIEQKFHEGDIIQPKDRGHEPWQIMQVDILDKKYICKDDYVIPFSHEDNYELVEQTPIWSEEDEEFLRRAINATKGTYPMTADWLKSIKDRVQPQSQWKPSEEMLEALYRATPENVMEKSEDEMLLDKLYQGLKYGRVLSKK